MTTDTLTPAPAPEVSAPVRHLQRRKGTNLAMTIVLSLAAALTVGVLLWVLGYVAAEGLKYLGPEFLTNTPPGNPADLGGGFLNGIIGSLEVVGIATALSVPPGIAAAVFIVEYGGRIASTVSFLTDVLVGLPTIVTGAFVYAVWVIRFGFSGIAGAIALALVMLPLVIRAAAEMLRLVPHELREASLALGVTRARTIVSVVLPTARSGIITGVMLAVARAMGETAPLLLTALGNDLFIEADPTHRMSTLSLQIFGNAITGFKAAQARAWAGALTLIAIVLLFTIAARLIGRTSRVGGR
ncbi:MULTISPECIES: phosphate ABC transporter permease PstA [Micromonospora]|uniref:Phosphate transport system permease protein PstA n=1 Tax=Micromonospora solifontis TaxID=2487138 RepID=A0ABX9WCG1_9ACTN|nr:MULTISPECIES: phosphate ABC transporter permease PstA [Micromonospora]NES17128.1 phosphate ABC transporter permease PstA [Micromonospora sp. PPF5-17B]NES38984.1 phosphate ABC transporter permease PstA [Micromonospora solifontis]NES58895.1 phosphate ABC transporter permease PstA [Micromonospora sp. PPF5-6]RNL91999.1 phosphate ABC transporter permease PstA [Micromonospora solifontis]